MDPKKKKEPPHTVVNGRKRYKMECRVDSQFRQPEPPSVGATGGSPNPPPANQATLGQGDVAGGTAGTETGANDDEVRVPVRVLSSIPTWSQMGWLGPQMVDNGHNNAYALRKMVAAINERPRPVPVMWDHSWSMRDKAGKLEAARWEESADIPPGVNADMVIRRSYDKRAADGLEGGEIDATSVSWGPAMEFSHPDMDFGQFVDLQGREVDGAIVRWLPVDLEAEDVYHHAMVWAGADPFSGPRNEHVGQAFQPADHEMADRNVCPTNRKDNTSTGEGGSGIMDKLIAAYQAVLALLGIEHLLDDKGTVPESLNERVKDRIGGLMNMRQLYNGLVAKLQMLEKPLLKDGEASLSAADIVERLPAELALAAHGRTYLADLRAEALKWFDSAKVDPGKAEMSAEAKQIRAVIEQCSDLGQLKAYKAEYQAQTEARLGPQKNLRTSTGEEVPGAASVSGKDEDIVAGSRALFGKVGE